MTKLSVNINKIALIRNSRNGENPDLLKYTNVCIESGADGITVHPRPDLRHIRPDDVRNLSKLINKKKDVEFNIEGNPFELERGQYPGLMTLVAETLPIQCTLVPDSTGQLTSDHGFDLQKKGNELGDIIQKLKQLKVRSSLFLDPNPDQIKLAAQLGVDRIELYTGPYAAAWGTKHLNEVFERHKKAANLAQSLGIGVNAGHDLNLKNIQKYTSIQNILEVSIGHALTVEALYNGITKTIKDYKTILSSCQHQ